MKKTLIIDQNILFSKKKSFINNAKLKISSQVPFLKFTEYLQ